MFSELQSLGITDPEIILRFVESENKKQIALADAEARKAEADAEAKKAEAEARIAEADVKIFADMSPEEKLKMMEIRLAG